MAKSDILKGLATAAADELVKGASSKATSTTKKTTTAKKITSASTGKETTAKKSGLGDLVGNLAGNLDLSSMLTSTVTSAITNNVAKSALGFSDVNGDGKIDVTDIVQSIVKAFQGGKIDVKSLSGTITNVWNTAFKAGQDSKK